MKKYAIMLLALLLFIPAVSGIGCTKTKGEESPPQEEDLITQDDDLVSEDDDSSIQDDNLPVIQAELPVLNTGDYWIYDWVSEGVNEYTTAMTVTGEDTINGTDCYTIACYFDPPLLEAVDDAIMDVDKATYFVIKTQSAGTFSEIPFDMLILSDYVFSGDPYWPLEIGKEVDILETSTTATTCLDETETESEIESYTYKVEKYEEVTVDAGTFKCFKIVKYDNYDNVLYVEWYSDEVKNSVKEIDYEDDTVIELKSYSVAVPDTTAPVISGITLSGITDSSVIINWNTDEPAIGQVEYGTTYSYGSTSELGTVPSLNHSVELTGLDADTVYYYRVKCIDASGNDIISAGNTFNTEAKQVYNIRYEWDFMWQTWEYTAEIPISLYDYFADKSRSRDYAEYVLNPYDDVWMENLANHFIEQATEEGWDESYYVPFALSFVQSLPYTIDEITTGYTEYPRYPVETIVDDGGDCEDTSILFASIVREMGYGVALLFMEDDSHMAVGVKISQSFIDNWDESYPLTYYTSADGSIYAYCETTAEGWGVGQLPDDLIGTAEIIDVY